MTTNPAATSSAHDATARPQIILVIGGGAAAMTIVQQLTDLIETGHLHPKTRVIWLVEKYAHEGGGASPSGGWFAVFSCDDPRAAEWAARSYPWWRAFRRQHPHLGQYFEDTPTLLLSHRGTPPIPGGHPGEPTEINPRRKYGRQFTQRYGVEMDSGQVINTVKFLPAWAAELAAHPNVTLDRLPIRVAGPGRAADLARFYSADITYVAIGLGAIAWGDSAMEARFGWLLRGPLVPGIATTHTLMLDDDDKQCVYSIPRRTPGDEHAMYGGIVTHLDELADWQLTVEDPVVQAYVRREARRLAEEGRLRAMKEIPMLKPALQDPSVLQLWHGFRPYRRTVFADQLDRTTALDQNVWMLHGLGGSGWTITPAVAADMISKSLGSPDREIRVGSS